MRDWSEKYPLEYFLERVCNYFEWYIMSLTLPSFLVIMKICYPYSDYCTGESILISTRHMSFLQEVVLSILDTSYYLPLNGLYFWLIYKSLGTVYHITRVPSNKPSSSLGKPSKSFLLSVFNLVVLNATFSRLLLS